MRAPRLEDEAQVYAAETEFSADGFNFVVQAGEAWVDCLARLERERAGEGLAPGRVPATMLFGLVGTELVGRVRVRHELTLSLLELEVGGHIGYVVRPAYRRRGYATRLLAVGLDVLRELGDSRALVTCDDGNIASASASASTIERNRGVLGNVVSGADGPKRRYWIDLTD